MKKIVAMSVAMVVGLIFVSTVSAQLKLEKFVKPKQIKTKQIEPKETEPQLEPRREVVGPLLAEPRLAEARRVCFPQHNYSEATVMGNSIWSVEARYFYPDGKPYVIVHTEKCRYMISVDSYAEAVAIQNVLTTVAEKVVLWMFRTDPVECLAPLEGWQQYRCFAIINSIYRSKRTPQ